MEREAQSAGEVETPRPEPQADREHPGEFGEHAVIELRRGRTLEGIQIPGRRRHVVRRDHGATHQRKGVVDVAGAQSRDEAAGGEGRKCEDEERGERVAETCWCKTLTLPLLRNGSLPLPLRGRGA